ncbi:hypothetical protein DFQ28_008500 [Apophysomyces sp. BC1034]|nr:hypothetical protein DFQ30_009295 [Apophysomyces sp. BC1015]KAG0181823.1 hypothetical protein DFQ29_006934 [Apophysomyces sp. BC1021]KAG0192624.1 hypothetical protein DFQ28_008500 [Apophysomyces sp. BC1034]
MSKITTPPQAPLKKRQRLSNTSPNQTKDDAAEQASGPPIVALPPPILPYPPPHVLVQSPYYPVYHYVPVPSPDPNRRESSSSSSSNVRLLPKTSPGDPTTSPVSYPSHFYHPYAIQMSPQLHPTAVVPNNFVRHNSISSSPGLGPTSIPTTADQREQARKVSHSAIERRRRERINDKIVQLKQLIPSCADQDNLHKMSILQSAIDYIGYLKMVVEKLDGNQDRLRGGHLQVKTAKSMLPKEIEPFTTQFSVNDEADDGEIWSSSSQPDNNKSSSPSSAEITKGLKPMDVIRSGNSISPSKPPSVSPSMTPPSEETEEVMERQDKSRSPSQPPTPVLTPRLPISGEEGVEAATDRQRHMSLEKLLC